MLLVDRRDVIEPVEIRDRLQIGLLLDQLLGAAMQQPDMRIDALDHFAVEFEHEAQHAVRRRMLRPEIDGEVAWWRLGFGHHATSRQSFAAFGREPRIEFVPHHDETLVPALADQIDAVMRLDREGHTLAGHRDAFDIDRHRHARRRRREVADVDMHAEAALARIEMRRQKLGADPFHQHDHVAGGEHFRHRRRSPAPPDRCRAPSCSPAPYR